MSNISIKMNKNLLIIIVLLTYMNILIDARSTTILQQLNFLAEQNPLVTQMFKVPFSKEMVESKSKDMAFNSCHDSFKWERWNCPSTNFYGRQQYETRRLDPEQVYINAITTAAILYNINKDCSSGVFSDCGCNENNKDGTVTPCSDDPQKAEQLFRQMNSKNSNSMQNNDEVLNQHNFNVVTTLIRKSLERICSRNNAEENCIMSLKPFASIAEDIYYMYKNSVKLDLSYNTKIIWQNVPLDELVHNAKSPDYCQLDAVPFWNGVRGRQCIYNAENTNQPGSCNQLCQSCGHKIAIRHVISEHRCNCKLNWRFQLICEKCISMEQQHYCY